MSTVPDQFLNTHYVVTKSENVDEFLAVRGVPWLIRKLIAGSMKSGQFQLKLHGDGYSLKTGDPSKNLEYQFTLGQQFEAVGFDGKQHKITFTVEGDRLFEHHINLGRNNNEDTFEYFFEGDLLVMICTAEKDGKKAVWRREFAPKF